MRYKIRTSAYNITTAMGVALAALCIACRVSTSLADMYATKVYPVVSDVLSWLSSPVPFNLEEITIVAIVMLSISIIILGARRRWGWKRCVKYVFAILLWTYVWFYMAWCNNYSRSSIFVRTSAVPAKYDKAEFLSFCRAFITKTNECWTDTTADNHQLLELEVKALYAMTPKEYGLSEPRSWHHPKPILFKQVYSAVGILGFMAPLYGESLLNGDLLAYDYPYTYAHEYAHMLGVSSEAEASWWAYNICLSSKSKAVRYSGQKNILPYVLSNARMALTEEEYEQLLTSVDQRVLKDLEDTRLYWSGKRSTLLNTAQSWVYDAFLKSNNIPSGLQNYSEVVGMLISLRK